MKYTCEIEINKPRATVIELFDSTTHIFKWMKGLQSFEHLSGVAGEVGAKSKLVFKNGKREFTMIETITLKNLPDEFNGTYESNDVLNIVNNTFIPLSDNTTKYISQQEFQFKGGMKIVAFLIPGMFKKQSMKYMIDFKDFVENYQ